MSSAVLLASVALVVVLSLLLCRSASHCADGGGVAIVSDSGSIESHGSGHRSVLGCKKARRFLHEGVHRARASTPAGAAATSPPGRSDLARHRQIYSRHGKREREKEKDYKHTKSVYKKSRVARSRITAGDPATPPSSRPQEGKPLRKKKKTPSPPSLHHTHARRAYRKKRPNRIFF
ncbi:hypothetical protein TW95_gp1645 [Pandoravirus inopinatum]|uniref:Uncharacterized protein n=1 Tax=Pandoravirus inopinatum TaxID=1605721 RepID=A0A0B5J431_9VIRU|nr:hypothetical protein TW95_gp1645 [Pandoravirus inopinatum]AJF98379.1 hypothetical protein [Pandoravirus inopinatum]